MRITSADLDIQREPFARPFAFKGSAFHEKWNLIVRLRDEAGTEAYGIGGLAVLWSDAQVFSTHTEMGGNALMVGTLERALQACLGFDWERPQDLLSAVRGVALDFAQVATRRGNDLQPTFVLNALVALDNAAWVLWARRHGTAQFDQWVPDSARSALGQRQPRVALTPAVGYNMPDTQILQLLDDGAAVLKVKIGAPGNESEMVSGDCQSLRRLEPLIREARTPLTESGRVLLYLDANGRYQSKAALCQLLKEADRLHLLDRIAVLEEPFAAPASVAETPGQDAVAGGKAGQSRTPGPDVDWSAMEIAQVPIGEEEVIVEDPEGEATHPAVAFWEFSSESERAKNCEEGEEDLFADGTDFEGVGGDPDAGDAMEQVVYLGP